MNRDRNSSSPLATLEPAEPLHASVPTQRGGLSRWLVAVVLLILIAGGVYFYRAQTRFTPVSDSTVAPPTVTVSSAKLGAATNTFVLPGNAAAYSETPIYAHTNGYLLHWYYDIGAHVKKGALLADISTPEVDKQLAQAEAQLATAIADNKNAQAFAQRYTGLAPYDAVSQQQTDTYVNQAKAAAAAVRAAQANMQSLKALQEYEKVYAPFDGIITARNIDTGQLVSNGTGQELFHIQQINPLRVYANVPQNYASSIKKGMKVDLTFPDYPRQVFTGTVVRTANAIDPQARTLLVEVDVENRAGKLFPGELAQVHFIAPAVVRTFVEPSAAVIFRHEGLQIGMVVNGNRAHLVHIAISQDDGANVQISSGLHAGDQVILDPPDSLYEGELVHVVHADAPPAEPGR